MPDDRPNAPVSSALDAASARESRLRERVRSLQLPPPEPRAGSRVGWIVAAVLLLGVGYFVWTGMSSDTADESAPTAAAPASDQTADKPSAPAPDPSPAKAPAPAASSTSASRAGIVLESPGYITPTHRILVSPKVSGMLVKLNIEEGMRMKEGDTLGVIESVEYEADVARAKALLAVAEQKSLELERGSRKEEIDRARAELDEAKAKLIQLDADYQRATKLSKVGGVSVAELDAASAAFQSQQRRIDALKFALDLLEEGPRVERKALAKAEVQQAKADLVKAEWRLDSCTIRSPISGTILRKNAEEGNIVNPIAFNGSFSVCEIADLADLEVDLTIQERDISKVFQGQRCKVRANAYQNRVYEGYVSRLMPIADRAKGAVPVRVKVTVPADEEGVYLKPDMSCVVTFYAKSDAPATAQMD